MGVFLAQGQADNTEFVIPMWLMLLCSVVMALGTSIGGYRIIKSVGMDMVKLEKHQGFAADLAAVTCLFTSSVWDPGEHHAYENNGHNGCRCGKEVVLCKLGRCKGDGNGMDPHISGLWPHRILYGLVLYEDILIQS